MKKIGARRLWAVLLSCLLMVGMVPVASFAQGEPLNALVVNGVAFVVDGQVQADAQVPGVTYDHDTNTLTLNNATIDQAAPSQAAPAAAGIYTDGSLILNVEGENTISGEDIDFGMAVEGTLSVVGDGTLTAEGRFLALAAVSDLSIADTVAKLDVTGGDQALASFEGSVTIGGEEYTKVDQGLLVEYGKVTVKEIPVDELYVNGVAFVVDGQVQADAQVPGVTYDHDANTLTLNNATIDTPDSNGLGIYAVGSLVLKLQGNNTIAGEGMDYGVAVEGNLSVVGDGTLVAKGDSCALSAVYHLSIADTVAKLDVTGEYGALETYQGSITIGGEAYTGYDWGLVVEYGKVTVKQHPVMELYVNGVAFVVDGQVQADAQVPGVTYDHDTNTLTLNNATIDTSSYDAGSPYEDGIYVNGDLTLVLIGESIIDGEGIEYGLDADPGSISILGNGTLVVKGSENGIYCNGLLTVGENTMVTAEGTNWSGIYAEDLQIQDNGVVVTDDLDVENDVNLASGLLVVGEEGHVKGKVTLTHDLVIPQGTTITIDEDSELIVPDSVKLQNQGTLVVDGTLTTNQEDLGTVEGDGTVRPLYILTSGDGSTYTQESAQDLTFTASGPLEKFDHLEVDGQVVDPANYQVASGSTVVTLKAAYLDTLAVGEHLLAICYQDGGKVEGTFEILEKSGSIETDPDGDGDSDTDTEENPGTGDSSDLILWTALLFVTGTGAMALYRKKIQR